MKVNILYHKDEGLQRRSEAAPQIQYEFQDLSLSPSEHVTRVCTLFEESGVSFKSTSDLVLLSDEDRPLDESRVLLQHIAEDPRRFHLVLHPRLVTQSIIQLLKENTKVKETVFHLKTRLENRWFVEEFIKSGGVPVLVDAATESMGNTQSYALAALQAALYHLEGIRLFLETPSLARKLYLLLLSTNVTVVRQTLELLVVLCTFDEAGVAAIKEAAADPKACGSNEPFTGLVKKLESGDLDTQVFSLCLINSLIAGTPSDQVESFVQQLHTDLGLGDILKLLLDIKAETFRTQLELYERLSKQTLGDEPLPGAHESSGKKKAKEFQQPMFPLLRKEIHRAQRKTNELVRLAENLPPSAYKPLQRFANQLTHLETDLSALLQPQEVMQNTIDELEGQLHELQGKGTRGNKPLDRRSRKSHRQRTPLSLAVTEAENEADAKKRKKKNRRSGDPTADLEAEELSPAEVAWKEERARLTETIRHLTDQVEAQHEELRRSKVQQQEAANNVKKLAQVVKLMKSKYDALKDQLAQQDISPRGEKLEDKLSTSAMEVVANATSASDDVSSPDVSAMTLDTPLTPSHTSTRLECALRFEVEETVVVEREGGRSTSDVSSLDKLREENEELKRKNEELQQSLTLAASLDSMANMVDSLPSLNDTDLSPDFSAESILPWHVLHIQPDVAMESVWSQVDASQTTEETAPSDLPDTKALMAAIRLLDDEAISLEQMSYLHAQSEKSLAPEDALFPLQEQFPALPQRLTYWRFIRMFTHEASIIERHLDVIIEASQQVRSSDALQQVLTMVVQVGNEINRGNIRQNAVGIYIDSLAQLSPLLNGETSVGTRCLTMISNRLRAQDSTLGSQLQQQLSSLRAASITDLNAVQSNLKQLEEAKKKVEEYSSLIEDEDFRNMFAVRHKQECEFLSCLQEQWNLAQEMYRDLVLYFTNDAFYSARLPSQLFFRNLCVFISELCSALSQ